MVNSGLRAAIVSRKASHVASIARVNPGVSSVNQFLSKPVEFSENSDCIRLECGPCRKSAVQACLLAYPVRQRNNGRKRPMRIRDSAMFFLLRVGFWLTVVLVLLPTGSSQPIAQGPQVGAADAVVAASAAVSDVSAFCGRQPEACTVGANAAVAIGHRAQAGAKMVYEFINDRVASGDIGSPAPGHNSDTRTGAATPRTVPTHPGSQTTLKLSDLEAAWQGPPRLAPVPLPLPRPRAESVPLPRPRHEPPV